MTELSTEAHTGAAPSDWIVHWTHLLRPSASVLDVACGHGRHARWFAARGCRVTAVDRDADAALQLQAVAEVCIADIENGPWPLADRRFDAVVVTNYLWRPLMPVLIRSVAPGGLLLYETFGAGQQTVGRPSNPQFLLQPGELLLLAAGLRVVAFEDGFLEVPQRFVQRIAAVREIAPETAAEAAGAQAPKRYWLGPPEAMAAQLKCAELQEPE